MNNPLPRPGSRPRVPFGILAAVLALLLAGGCAAEPGDQAEARTPEAGVRPTPPAEAWTPPRRAASSDTGESATSTAAASDTTPGAGGAAGTGGPAAPRRAEAPDLGHTVGSDQAPVQVLEFSDFGCGYCRQFHLETWSALEEEFVETGKVEWTYIPMSVGMFGANSITAAEVGECAIEQGRFPPVRERLFEEQARWKRSADAMTVFREIVREEGLDMERWQSCMDEDRRLSRVVSGTRLAQQVGLRGTPTFLVLQEGTIPGAVPLEIFRQILDQVHARRSGS